MDAHIIERLSEHLDGDLAAEETAAVEAHLRVCSRCAQVRDELRKVREAGAALPDWGPETDLWPGILAQVTGAADRGIHAQDVIALRDRRTVRVGGALRSRQVRLTLPQLVAASVALIFFSGAAALALWPAGADAVAPPGVQSPFAQLVADGGDLAEIDDQVAAFEALLDEHRSELAANTVRILEKNLEIIDRAIEESRWALERDPSSVFLQGHLAEALQRKVGYLREAARIVEAAA